MREFVISEYPEGILPTRRRICPITALDALNCAGVCFIVMDTKTKLRSRFGSEAKMPIRTPMASGKMTSMVFLASMFKGLAWFSDSDMFLKYKLLFGPLETRVPFLSRIRSHGVRVSAPFQSPYFNDKEHHIKVTIESSSASRSKTEKFSQIPKSHRSNRDIIIMGCLLALLLWLASLVSLISGTAIPNKYPVPIGDFHYEAIVVGGGPAGLAALSALARVRRKALLIDSGEYRNGPTRYMHDVLGYDGNSPSLHLIFQQFLQKSSFISTILTVLSDY